MGSIDGRATDDLEGQDALTGRVHSAEAFQGNTVARKDQKVGGGEQDGVLVDFVLCVRLLTLVAS